MPLCLHPFNPNLNFVLVECQGRPWGYKDRKLWEFSLVRKTSREQLTWIQFNKCVKCVYINSQEVQRCKQKGVFFGGEGCLICVHGVFIYRDDWVTTWRSPSHRKICITYISLRKGHTTPHRAVFKASGLVRRQKREQGDYLGQSLYGAFPLGRQDIAEQRA